MNATFTPFTSESAHLRRILITGSEGLVGSALRAALEARGTEVAGLDVRGAGDEEGDVRDAERIRQAAAGCCGIVHLAAVSRVVWGERDPENCWAVNVGGLRNVLAAAATVRAKSSGRPWVVFASSREVYGQPDRLPATEDTPLRPINVYGRSKVEGERLVEGGPGGRIANRNRPALQRLREHARPRGPGRPGVRPGRRAGERPSCRRRGSHVRLHAHRRYDARASLRSSTCWRTGRRSHRRFTCSRASSFRSGSSRRWRRISPGPGQPSRRRRHDRSTYPASTAIRRVRENCSVGFHTWRFSRALARLIHDFRLEPDALEYQAAVPHRAVAP